MGKDKEAFLKELLNDFKIEAAEHLQAIVNGLVELEKALHKPDNVHIIESVFREIHSIKGAARAVNQLQIERLCMRVEGVFYEIKKGKLLLKAPMFDVFFQFTDMLNSMLNEIDSDVKSISENSVQQLNVKLIALSSTKSHLQASPEAHETSSSPFIADDDKQQMQAIDQENNQQDHKAITHVKKDTDAETIRVATAKLYEMLHKAEEMISIKGQLHHQARQLQSLAGRIGLFKKRIGDHVSDFRISHDNFIDSPIINELEHLKNYQAYSAALADSLNLLHRSAGRAVDDLVLSIRKTMMQPFSSLIMIVPRIVRDLSKEYNKELKLEFQGADTEIDRRILEEMKDPLIHIIRNCIDHGMESREERLKKNKKATGLLKITANTEAGQKIIIEIIDDGRGIDREKLVRAAISAGKITKSEAQGMSDNEIDMLIFSSGVSTSPFITDVSGLGLGMAIVAEKIAILGGNIDVKSEKDAGTTFTITLPQTLATFRGILVKASDSGFLLPVSAIVKAIQITPKDIKKVESRNTVQVDTETLGIVILSDVLGMRRRHTGVKKQSFQGLVIQHAQKKLVFIVEDVLGEHEGVVKTLGPHLKNTKNIAGAILSGDGKILPVLNVADLFATASGLSHRSGFDLEDQPEKNIEKKPTHVLIAEDSITVRNMIRNYLESAGFHVKTAVDGLEAYELLQAEQFDIVVSDVEMPRMNGFEFTEKIREDANTTNMPIILVTALESADDRRRGMEAGANAYIVKSSFEKGNLIDTINRLI